MAKIDFDSNSEQAKKLDPDTIECPADLDLASMLGFSKRDLLEDCSELTPSAFMKRLKTLPKHAVKAVENLTIAQIAAFGREGPGGQDDQEGEAEAQEGVEGFEENYGEIEHGASASRPEAKCRRTLSYGPYIAVWQPDGKIGNVFSRRICCYGKQ